MEKIILYSTDCPKCKVLTKKLEENGIEYDIEKSVDKMIALDITEVPMLLVNGTLMSFRDACIWVGGR